MEMGVSGTMEMIAIHSRGGPSKGKKKEGNVVVMPMHRTDLVQGAELTDSAFWLSACTTMPHPVPQSPSPLGAVQAQSCKMQLPPSGDFAKESPLAWPKVTLQPKDLPTQPLLCPLCSQALDLH